MDSTKDNDLDILSIDGKSPSYSHSNDTITLSSSSINDYSTVLNGGYNFSNASVTAGYPYTFSNTGAVTGAISGGAGGSTYGSPWATTTSPKIRLDGEGADIEVNGWSLIDAIKKIEERLNILTPNTKLEEEWDELKVLGDQYRKLEQHIKDKQATWDKLKAMPPPEVY